MSKVVETVGPSKEEYEQLQEKLRVAKADLEAMKKQAVSTNAEYEAEVAAIKRQAEQANRELQCCLQEDDDKKSSGKAKEKPVSKVVETVGTTTTQSGSGTSNLCWRSLSVQL